MKNDNKEYSLLIIIICILCIIPFFFIPDLISNYIQSRTILRYINRDIYYNILICLVTGLVTLLALSWQFSRDRRKTHDEKVINSRGLFELNYIKIHNKVNIRYDLNKLKAFICMDNLPPDPNLNDYIYLTMRLNQQSVYDCTITFSCDNEETIIGLVVPGQLIIVPKLVTSDQFTIVIEYRTIMEEKIRHTIIFEHGIEEKASFEKLEGKIIRKPEDLFNDDNYHPIFTSKSRLFPYNQSEL